jgi:hypothetical protein
MSSYLASAVKVEYSDIYSEFLLKQKTRNCILKMFWFVRTTIYMTQNFFFKKYSRKGWFYIKAIELKVIQTLNSAGIPAVCEILDETQLHGLLLHTINLLITTK